MGVWVELLTACRPSATFANEFLYKTETLQPLRLNFYAMQSLRFYKKSIFKPAGPPECLQGLEIDSHFRQTFCMGAGWIFMHGGRSAGKEYGMSRLENEGSCCVIVSNYIDIPILRVGYRTYCRTHLIVLIRYRHRINDCSIT